MKFDNSLHQGEANACALCFRIQFIKKTEDLSVILGGNTHTIVFYKENRLATLSIVYTYFNARIGLVAHEFGGIIDQVLQKFCQALAISIHCRQARLSLNRDPA